MNSSGADAASEALRDLRRTCEATRSRWSDAARGEWDRNYYEPVMVDAGRIVESLVEAERQLQAAVKVLGRD